MLIGYRTRLFTVLSWFMMVSLHNRNGLILQGGDDLMRMILFWAIFLPWGARYSCDSLLNSAREKEVCSVATFAYILQICYLYTGSALLKGPEWDTNYTAVYYAYSLDQLAFPLAKALYYYPELLKVLTCIAYYFELLVPLLFFIPFRHDLFRAIGVFSILLFHFCNEITLLIGLFPAIGVATALGLLPGSVMSWMESRAGKLKQKVVVALLWMMHYIRYVIPLRTVRRRTKPIFLERMKQAFLVFLILFVFDWNLSNLSVVKSKLGEGMRFIGYALRVDQSWGMFAPGVLKDDGWYVLEGITKKGEHFNLYDPDKKLSYNKPASVVSMFKNDRWRKYTENYIFSDYTYMRGYFCNYYKRIWNEQNKDKPINCLRVIYVGEFSLPDYKYSAPKPDVLWECMD
jgi:hypothetical protein